MNEGEHLYALLYPHMELCLCPATTRVAFLAFKRLTQIQQQERNNAEFEWDHIEAHRKTRTMLKVREEQAGRRLKRPNETAKSGTRVKTHQKLGETVSGTPGG